MPESQAVTPERRPAGSTVGWARPVSGSGVVPGWLAEAFAGLQDATRVRPPRPAKPLPNTGMMKSMIRRPIPAPLLADSPSAE